MNQGEIFSKEIGSIDEDCKAKLRKQIDYTTLQSYKNIRFLGILHVVIILAVLFGTAYTLYVVDKKGFFAVCVCAAIVELLVILSLSKNLKWVVKKNKRIETIIYEAAIEELSEVINRERKQDYVKSGFIKELSFDIGTPVNTIMSLKDKIFKESTEPKVIEDLAKLNGVMNVLHAYVEDLNIVSTEGLSGLSIKNVPYDLGLMICDIENLGIRVANEKGITLKFDIDNDMPALLMGDVLHIELIILKLIANGLKYTDEGTVTLSVGYLDVSDKEILLNVSVEDTGQGIKEEDVERYFSKNKTAEDALIEGCSLAMVMSKTLLEKMDSELRVDSKFAQGSVFRFSIKQEVMERVPIGKREDVIERLQKKELKVRNISEEVARAVEAKSPEVRLDTVVAPAEPITEKVEPVSEPAPPTPPAPQEKPPEKPGEPEVQTEDAFVKNLSSLSELYVSEGIQNAGSEELYKKVISDFCDSAASKASDIEMYFEKEEIKSYTIEVHALKSAARIIGYKKLSKLAEALEEAGNANDMVRINNATGELIRMYRDIATKIENARGDNDSKDTIDEDSLKDAVRSIKEFAEVFDFDSIDFVMNELKKYSMPDSFKEKYAKLKTLVAQVARDDILKLLED